MIYFFSAAVFLVWVSVYTMIIDWGLNQNYSAVFMMSIFALPALTVAAFFALMARK